ncbi:MAG: tetratricopeptide repeat protein [Cytophagales bacterium]|nr:tetratricopeptide repeat protein [Cytophagales bacterium]
MKKYQLVLLVLVVIFFDAISQSPFQKAANLTGQEFVDYVNENYYQLYSTNFDSAILLTHEAKSISLENGWVEKAAYASLYNGVINFLRGDYEKAISSYQYAEKTFDSLNNTSGLARTHNEMAVYFHKNGQLEKAIALLASSEKEAEDSDDLEALGTSLGNRAAFLTRQGKYEEAYPVFKRVFDIRVKQNDSVGLGYVYLDLAEYQLHKGNLPEAIRLVEESTKIREAIGDRNGVAINTVIKGENYFQTGNYKQAIPYFEQTIELASEIGYTDLIRFSYDMLQQSHIKLKNYEKAYESLSKNRVFSDSIFNVERSKALLEMETKYETEKKEKQIAQQEVVLTSQEAALLQNRILFIASVFALGLLLIILLLWQNKTRKKQQLTLQKEKLKSREAEINATISSQEKERSRYARDLHDGFGQMISILNMNLANLKSGAKPDERQQVFEASEKIIEDMYGELKNICFDLMPQTLIRGGLASALEEFIQRVNSSSEALHVELNVFGLEERISEIQEISLFRISQEWINNILKYSDAKKITLQITKDEEEITLMIEDDGKGFNKNLLLSGKGNGWKNLNTRTNLIQGHLELETQPERRGNTLIVNAPAEVSRDNVLNLSTNFS